MSWKSKVYRPSQEEKMPKDWNNTKRRIWRLFDKRCARCEKPLTLKMATIHHIKPRAEGGKENTNNLCCLCEPCHNFVEIEGYRTLTEIQGSFDGIKRVKKEEVDEQPAIRWQQWVYGGRRRNTY